MESTLELHLEERFIVRLEDTAGMNENGTERKDLLAGCTENQQVYLRCDHVSTDHQFLIQVFNDTGQQIGSVHGEKEIAFHLDRGGEVNARIKRHVGKPGFFRKILNRIRKLKNCYLEVILLPLHPEAFMEYIEKDRDIARIIARAEAHEKDNIKLAIRNYRQAIDEIVTYDSLGLRARAWRQTRIPVNRLSMAYEKEGKFAEALKVIDWYLAYPDYHGIDPYEREMIMKRRERLAVASRQ
jgi:hypothetical protein